MRALLERVREARIEVSERVIGKIGFAFSYKFAPRKTTTKRKRQC